MPLHLIILTALALSMDAFAVSVSCGIAMQLNVRNSLKLPFSFGLFQAFMPIIGYYAASLFAAHILKYDHWVAFGLLLFIGIKMIIETFHEKTDDENIQSFSFFKLLLFSIATSIDALATGIGFAFFEINIFSAAVTIGVITFALSLIGVRFGKFLGSKSEIIAGITGGVILILIGFKILIEHLTA